MKMCVNMNDHQRWFSEARFGLFIHWGLYALPGGIWQGQEMDYIGEWLQAKFRIPNAEYNQLAAQFNPTRFDAEAWVLTARRAGMRYLVFTAKHHEGFAMYHSRVSRFNIVDATPFRRDVLAELAAACRKYDFKLGIYYSQDLDWHEADGGDPGSDVKNFGMACCNNWDFPDREQKEFQRYFTGKVMPQLTELLNNYGPIAVLWFDCPITISAADSERLVKLVKTFQPDCLINSRIGHGCGDYGSLGDNQLPATRRAGLWESPGTMNDTWGFKYRDQQWKTPRDVICNLASLASKDTNYLLNVGPQPDGCFPAAAVELMQQVGVWFERYGTAIRGTSGNPFPGDFNWGWVTVSPGGAGCFTRLNLLLRQPADSLTLHGVLSPVRCCFDPAVPERRLPFRQNAAGSLCLDLSDLRHDEYLSVVAVELETADEPEIDSRLMPQNGILILHASRGKLEHDHVNGKHGEHNVAATGEGYESDSSIRLDDTGCIVNWHHPFDRISWDICWPESTSGRLELVTVSRIHSASWVGGQQLKLEYDQDGTHRQWDVFAAGQAVADQTDSYYAAGIAELGTLPVRRAGVGRLTLTMLDAGSAEAQAMALHELRIHLLPV